jgi:hypothetical protein
MANERQTLRIFRQIRRENHVTVIGVLVPGITKNGVDERAFERQECRVDQGAKDIRVETPAIIIGAIEVCIVEGYSGQQSSCEPVVDARRDCRQLRFVAILEAVVVVVQGEGAGADEHAQSLSRADHDLRTGATCGR